MQNIMQLSEKFIYSIMQTESWVTDDGKKIKVKTAWQS